jgi:hypothetical protein
MDIIQMFLPAVNASHRVMCLVRGHELVMQFDRRRLSLRCIACGYRTPGWALGEPPVARHDIEVDVAKHWPANDQHAA